MGRDALVQEVVALFERVRVVSLVGLGGIGKTTTALAVAHRLTEAGQDVRFCELETETSGRGALERVCRSAGVDPGEDPVAALSALTGTPLVVLDNVEQVDGLGAALAEVLLLRRSGCSRRADVRCG